MSYGWHAKRHSKCGINHVFAEEEHPYIVPGCFCGTEAYIKIFLGQTEEIRYFMIIYTSFINDKHKTIIQSWNRA